MIRGKIVVATEEKLLKSVEFNGNMCVDDGGYGEEILKAFAEGITTEKEYKEYIQAFDSGRFNYAIENKDGYGENYFNNLTYIEGVREEYLIEDKQLNFLHDYYYDWCSDYIYLKNIGATDLYITCNLSATEKNVCVRIAPNGYVVLHFGDLTKYGKDFEVLTNEEEEQDTSFDGYWEMTNCGIVINDTTNDKEYDLTELDDCTIEHIVDQVRNGCIRGDIYGAYIDE